MLTIQDAKDLYYDAKESLDSVLCDDDTETEESNVEIIKFKRLISSLMAYPYIRPYLRCFMISVGCNVVESSEEDLKKMIEDKLDEDDELERDDVCEITAKLGGALYAEVERVMDDFCLTDRTGGGGGWSIGCHCTLMEAEVLSSLLSCKFASAINSGMLAVSWYDCITVWKED